jgi:hypothetical protein
MTRKRLKNLAILSIESSDSQKIVWNMDAIIEQFASIKSKDHLKCYVFSKQIKYFLN